MHLRKRVGNKERGREGSRGGGGYREKEKARQSKIAYMNMYII